MEKIVLIGEHIEHSRSPAFHNARFAAHALPYRYELMPLAADQVESAIAMMKRGGYRGANVTSPHKYRVIAALERLSPEAARIGAVNTILFEDGIAIGFNTDAAGFAYALRKEALLAAPFSAAVLGTGGGAMAAIDALLARPTLEDLTLYSRDIARALAATQRFDDSRLRARELAEFHPADLLINAAPVGMAAQPGALLAERELVGVKLLHDMIYAPAVTELMERALRAGARVINGEAMLIGQALESFRIWTGEGAGLEP